MPSQRIKETDLYPPVKAFLEAQGYEVKGEIGSADIVAVRNSEEPLIVELKCGFSLSLFHQAIDRLSITDTVYIAVPCGTGRTFRVALRRNIKLCRRLGVGLITVRMRDGLVEAHLDPTPYKPRKTQSRKVRLLRQFARLAGDPNTGGSTRRGIMTAYRQDALRCLDCLNNLGPTKAAKVAKLAGVTNARRLMADNHYGWFERIETGIYGTSPNGNRALEEYSDDIAIILGANLAKVA